MTKFKKIMLFLVLQFALGSLFLILFFYELSSGDLSRNWEMKCAIFVCITLALNIFIWIKNKNDGFSFFVLLTLFIVMFHLGQQIMVGFNLLNDEQKISVNKGLYVLGDRIAFQSSVYCMLFIYFFMFGGLLYSIYYKDKFSQKSYKDINTKLLACRITGWIMLLISLGPQIYCDSIIFKLALTLGYEGTFQAGAIFQGSPIDLIASFYKPAIIVLLSSYRNEKGKFNFLMIISICYLLIRMFITGDRGEDLIFIIVIFYMRHKLIKPIKFKNTLKGIIIIYFLLIILKIIQDTRLTSSLDINALIQAFKNANDNNIFLTTLFEYGALIWVFQTMYIAVPDTGSFAFGKTYFYALFGQVFSIMHITNYFMIQSDFSNFLKAPERGPTINSLTQSMGGSIIAEWYYNFGWPGIIFTMILGVIVVKFSLELNKQKNNPMLFALLCIVMNLSIWLVRQYFTTMVWHALVYCLFFGVLYLLCISFVKKKGRKKC